MCTILRNDSEGVFQNGNPIFCCCCCCSTWANHYIYMYVYSSINHQWGDCSQFFRQSVLLLWSKNSDWLNIMDDGVFVLCVFLSAFAAASVVVVVAAAVLCYLFPIIWKGIKYDDGGKKTNGCIENHSACRKFGPFKNPTIQSTKKKKRKKMSKASKRMCWFELTHVHLYISRLIFSLSSSRYYNHCTMYNVHDILVQRRFADKAVKINHTKQTVKGKRDWDRNMEI